MNTLRRLLQVGVLSVTVGGIATVGWAQTLTSEWSFSTIKGTNATLFETRLNVANFLGVYTRPDMNMGTNFGHTNQIQGKVLMGPEPIMDAGKTLHQVAHGVLNLTVPMALQKDKASYTHLAGSVRVLGYSSTNNTMFIRPKEMIQQRQGTTLSKGVYANLFVLMPDFLVLNKAYTLTICLDKESLDHPTPFVMTILQEYDGSNRYLTRRIAFAQDCLKTQDWDDDTNITKLPTYEVLWPGQHLGDGPLMAGNTLYTLFFVPSGKPAAADPKYYVLGDVIKGFQP